MVMLACLHASERLGFRQRAELRSTSQGRPLCRSATSLVYSCILSTNRVIYTLHYHCHPLCIKVHKYGFLRGPCPNLYVKPSAACSCETGFSVARTKLYLRNRSYGGDYEFSACHLLLTCSVCYSTLKMETTRPSEASVNFYQATPYHISEGSALQFKILFCDFDVIQTKDYKTITFLPLIPINQ
jgi:hypothetical protein